MRRLRLLLFSVIMSIPGQGFITPVPAGDSRAVSDTERAVSDTERAVSDIEWNRWIMAIIQVESGGDDFAVGLTNDNGCLQITPILVAEVNRLVGGELYLVSDAFSRRKSIEMFNIIQSHYNPQRDRHLALKIWNPKAPVSYHTKVGQEYEKLMNK